MGRVNASLHTSATSFTSFMMLEREINQQTQIVAIPKTNEMHTFD
jgi:hypothetical protein